MSRAVFLSLLLYALLFAGLAGLRGELLALALPVLALLGAGLLFAPQALDLQATRTVSPSRVGAGEPVQVQVIVTNPGQRLELVLLEDLLPPGLEITEGIPHVLCDLPPGGSVELAYTVRGRRGIYTFAGVRATAWDRLGLARRQALATAPGEIFVLPSAPRLRRVAIRPRAARVYPGEVPLRLGGAGTDFFGVRDYRSGDALRRLNWRKNAGRGEALYTNEFEQERVADVGLILDARWHMDVAAVSLARPTGGKKGASDRADASLQKSPFDSLFEHSVTAAAALAQALLGGGNRVGLLVYGGYIDWTFPGYGKLHFERILHALARAHPRRSLVFERLEYLPRRFFPARSQLVLLSPMSNGDLPFLVRLRAQGYAVLVISPDPVAFAARSLDGSKAAELGLRLARLERSLLVDQLTHAGIQVVSWDVAMPIDQALGQALSRSPARGQALARWFQQASP